MNCCNSFGICERGPGCPAGSIVATKLLAGEPLPELEPYEFGPGMFLFNTANSDGSDPEADTDESILTPKRVLIGCGIFLAVCVGVGVAALQFWRP